MVTLRVFVPGRLGRCDEKNKVDLPRGLLNANPLVRVGRSWYKPQPVWCSGVLTYSERTFERLIDRRKVPPGTSP